MFSITAIIENIIASWLDRTFTKKWFDKKRVEQLQNAIDGILHREQENKYYNYLDRVLCNTDIIENYISSVCKMRSFSLEERIEEVWKHNNAPEEAKIYITHILKILCQTIHDILLKGDSSDTDRIYYVIDNDTEKILTGEKEIRTEIQALRFEIMGSRLSGNQQTPVFPLSGYESEKVPDENRIFRRRIYPNDTEEAGQDVSLKDPIDYVQDNKYIVIVAEAGFGKTYVLYQVYYEAKEKLCHPIFLSLRQNGYTNLLKMMDQGLFSIDCNCVLLLDGLDEVKEEQRTQLLNMIQSIRERYPEVCFVLSVRTVFYTTEITGCKAYGIKPLDNSDIIQYLNKKSVPHHQFMRELIEKKLDEMCENAFYFTEIVNIWLEEQRLPSAPNIMGKIIQSRISNDKKKFEFIAPEQIERRKRLFEKIAMIMQCTQRYQLTNEEMEYILRDEQLINLSYDGLWECNNDQSWSFTHNNFKEFFTAVALSRLGSLEKIRQFITETIDREYIRPSWYNVLSFLITIYKGPELFKWIGEIQPELLADFEKDRFTPEERTGIYVMIMESYKASNDWINPDGLFRRRLAALCENEGTVKYILEEINGNNTDRQVQNLLRSLIHFESFFCHEKEIKEAVAGIAFDRGKLDYLRSDAIRVMETHQTVFADLHDQIIQLYESEQSETVIYSIIRLINEYGKTEENIRLILDAYERFNNLECSDLSLKLIISTILKNISSKTAAYQVLNYYTSNPDRLLSDHDSISYFIHCCDIAAKVYDGDQDIVLKCLLNALDEKKLYCYHDAAEGIRHYIEATHTEGIFFNKIISTAEKWDAAYIISYIACDSMIRYVINEYEQGRVKTEQIKDLICHIHEEGKSNQLKKALFLQTGEQIKDNYSYEEHMSLEAKGHQDYFNSLFDRQQYVMLIETLSQIAGTDCIIQDIDMLDYYREQKVNTAVRDAYYSLLYLLGDNSEVTKLSEVMDKIGDWDWFVLFAAENAIRNHEKDIRVSEEQKNHLCRIIMQHLKPEYISITISDKGQKTTFPMILRPCLYIISKLDIDCPEDFIIRMLDIPCYLFDKEEYDQIPSYIKTHLTYEKLTQQIIQNIQKRTWNALTAPAYINYCKENHIKEVKQNMIEFLSDEAINRFGIYAAVDYLDKEFGYGLLLESVLPECKDEEVIKTIARHVPNNSESDLLDQKLMEAYEATHDVSWMELLINRSNVFGLEMYYQQAKECMTLPDMTEGAMVPTITEAIREVRKIRALPILIQLLQLAYTPDFADKKSFGLLEACWNALSNIAVEYYFEVYEALQKTRTFDQSEADTGISDLMRSIRESQERAIDSPMSFETALMLVTA